MSAARNRAPFRHLSTRALRQAVLRASSRLAPSRSTRPCDLPVRKTRDASNRLLPPEQVTCTRSPYVPGSLGPLSRSGTPRDDPWSSRGMTEGPGVFTTPETARAPSSPNANPRAFDLAASGHERGPVRPAALDETRPLTPLSRIPLSLPLTHLRACRVRERLLMVSERVRGLEERGTRQGHRRRRLVKTDDCEDDPRCLPSTGTLPRIRWPLQPRSRDRRTAFGDVATAG